MTSIIFTMIVLVLFFIGGALDGWKMDLDLTAVILAYCASAGAGFILGCGAKVIYTALI